MALTKVSTDGVKDDAVTTDKLANAINTERTANTAKTQTTINNNANNRIITGSNTASTLEGEANLTYDGSGITLTGTNPYIDIVDSNNDSDFSIKNDNGTFEINDATNSDATRLAIDSSGRVLIGTTTEGNENTDELTVAGSANSGITIRSGTSNWGQIHFSDGTSGDDEYRGIVGYNHTDNYMKFNTNCDERMRIDSSGNVGIGTTSPTKLLHIQDAAISGYGSQSGTLLVVEDTGDTSIEIASGHNSTGSIFFGDSGSSVKGSINYSHGTGGDVMTFHANGSERMRVNSGGQLCIGNSSPAFASTLLNIERTNGDLLSLYKNGGNDDHALIIQNQRASGSTYASFVLIKNSSNSGVGSIAANGSSTNFNTSSDYRLKENVTAISNGITRLKTLKPSRFNFKADKDTTVDGFLAHEVTAVPEAISGTKDQVATADTSSYKKGDPIYQSIDQSKLVPLLTAALQEEIGKREALEARVAALEAA